MTPDQEEKLTICINELAALKAEFAISVQFPDAQRKLFLASWRCAAGHLV